jgi:hypothetical protein
VTRTSPYIKSDDLPNLYDPYAFNTPFNVFKYIVAVEVVVNC